MPEPQRDTAARRIIPGGGDRPLSRPSAPVHGNPIPPSELPTGTITSLDSRRRAATAASAAQTLAALNAPPPAAPAAHVVRTAPTPAAPVVRAIREDHMDNNTSVADPDGAVPEPAEPAPSMPAESVHDHEGWENKLAHIVSEAMKDVKDGKVDKNEMKRIFETSLKMLDDQSAADQASSATGKGADAAGSMATANDNMASPETKDEEEAMDESIKALKTSSDPKDVELYESVVAAIAEDKKVAIEHDGLTRAKAFDAKVATGRKLCMESVLKDFDGGVTDLFLEDLAAATDERRMRLMIQERANLFGRVQPKSLPGYVGGSVGGGKDLTNEQFMAAMKNGGSL